MVRPAPMPARARDLERGTSQWGWTEAAQRQLAGQLGGALGSCASRRDLFLRESPIGLTTEVNHAISLILRPRVEEHLSHNLTDALRLSADAYNVGGETSIDGTSQGKDRSAPAWDYASGAVLTLFLTMNAWPLSPLRSQMRKRYAS